MGESTTTKTPSIGVVGAGRLGMTLAIALKRAHFSVKYVASRRPAVAAESAAAMPARSAADIDDVCQAELVILTVPDDAIALVATSRTWRPGQFVVHCSGAIELSVLVSAANAGAIVGGLHPMQNFSDVATAIALLPGTTAGIEAPEPLKTVLLDIGVALKMIPMQLSPGARAMYHAGGLFAGTFLLSILAEAVQAWSTFGATEAQTLRALLPVTLGTLQTAERKGLASAVAGPISHGDASVVRCYLAAIRDHGGCQSDIYKLLARRQLALMQQRQGSQVRQFEELYHVLETESVESLESYGRGHQ